MQYHFSFAVLVSVGLIIDSTYCHLSGRHSGDANGDVFNLLLGLYKINPLKGSRVYKTFKDNVLQGRTDKSHVVFQFDSEESYKVKSNLNEIEKVIHVPNKRVPKTIKQPEYDVNDVDIENFTVDIILNDRISKEQFKRTLEDVDSFRSLYTHIGSNEIANDIPVTRLLPINDKNSLNSQLSNQNDAIYKYIENDRGNGNYMDPLAGVRNDMRMNGYVMDEKLDGMPGVIVL